MFEHVIVHQQRAFDPRQPLDLGLLAEAMLFYKTVELPINDAVLRQITLAATPEGVLELVQKGNLKLTHRDDFAAIRTENVGTPQERYAPITCRIETPSGRPVNHEDFVPQIITQIVGREGRGRRLARRLLDKIKTGPTDPAIVEHLSSDFEDNRYTTAAALAVVRTLAPEYEIPLGARFNLFRQGEFFSLDTNLNIADANALYKKRVPSSQLSIDTNYILSCLLNTRLDLDDAALKNAELSVNAIQADLTSRRLTTAMSARRRSEESLAAFQDFVFDEGHDIREVINSGARSFAEFVSLLDRADRFREWFAGQTAEPVLIKQYYQEIVRSTWIEKLPAKSVRFILFTGTGVGLDLLGTGGLGTTVAVALSLADQFVLDKILKGWRPHQFVEGPWKKFITSPSSSQ